MASQKFLPEDLFDKSLKAKMANILSSLFQAEKEIKENICVPKSHSLQHLFFLYPRSQYHRIVSSVMVGTMFVHLRINVESHYWRSPGNTILTIFHVYMMWQIFLEWYNMVALDKPHS